MMLLLLANIGSLMADTFRIIYKNLCCCFTTAKKRESPTPAPSTSLGKTKSQTAPEHNKNSIGSVDKASALRQIPGRSNYVHHHQTKTHPNRSALQELVKKTTPLPGVSESLFISLAGSNSVFTKALQVRKECRNVQVPVWLILLMFFLYLIMGAVVFGCWEGWGYLDAMYFVFVTVSTIGFGDLLPGIDDPNPVHRTNKLIGASAYLLLGLAMVAMCFDLMQMEVKRRSKRLARRIGLISSM